MRVLAVAVLVVAGACGPPRSADRVFVQRPDAGTERPSGPASADAGDLPDMASGGPEVAGGRADRPLDASPPPISGPDPAPAPPDAADAPAPEAQPPDAAPEPAPPDAPADLPPDARIEPDAAPAAQLVQLVVGDPAAPFPGDIALRTVLALHRPGLSVRLHDDGAAVDVEDVRLVVIAGSVSSDTVRGKYRDVAVPVLCLEYTLFDDLGMTAAQEETDLGGAGGTSQVGILDEGHPLAAGLSGLVTVVSAPSNLSWGNPRPGAARVASIPGLPSRVAVFAYPKGAAMAALPAPARRLGFFALESAAARLSEEGIQLLGAAIDWALLSD
jgi:hypothetical protein